jgi:hypothetical protein
LLLRRAGLASLNLEVGLPVDGSMLEVVSSQNISILSLSVLSTAIAPLPISGFQNLNLSQLQELKLGGMWWIQSKFIMDLALNSCPNLRTLEIHDCGIEYFIGSVLENLQDAKYFPSLGLLTINSSWPVKLDISYDEFRVQCSSKRPEFYISGNGQEELPEIGSDAYELESYVESD